MKENDAFFVTTNAIITTAQTQGHCPEVSHSLSLSLCLSAICFPQTFWRHANVQLPTFCYASITDWFSTIFQKTDRISHNFYRAVHFNAKRGLAIACRPSVCPSVTLVICDHIGWKSWKLIARTISPLPSLFVAKRRSTYSQRNMGKFGGDYRGGV